MVLINFPQMHSRIILVKPAPPSPEGFKALWAQTNFTNVGGGGTKAGIAGGSTTAHVAHDR